MATTKRRTGRNTNNNIYHERSLRKIQPKSKNKKIYSSSPFNNLLKKVGVVFGIILVVYLIFIFEFPANYPNKFKVSNMTLDSNKIQMQIDTDSYKGKLIPLDLLLNIGKGEITLVGEKETTIVFANNKKIILKEGSRKIKINGKTQKFNAPVVKYKELILVPGELAQTILPKMTKFNNGKISFTISQNKPEGEYQKLSDYDGYLRLVNKENPLTKNYEPTDLVNVNSLNSITAYGTNTKLRDEAARALAKMYKENEVQYAMSSGFRNFANQTELFNQEVADNKKAGKTEEEAIKLAGTVVAVPGTSEHQLGLSVDLAIPGVVLTEEFKNTPAGKWLSTNGYKYGYVLRYTKEQTEITNIIYEPWHFRYIGYPHSEILVKEKIVFDTYIKNIRDEKVKYFQAEDGNDYLIWLLTGSLKPDKFEFNTSNGIGVSSDNAEGIILTMRLENK